MSVDKYVGDTFRVCYVYTQIYTDIVFGGVYLHMSEGAASANEEHFVNPADDVEVVELYMVVSSCTNYYEIHVFLLIC